MMKLSYIRASLLASSLLLTTALPLAAQANDGRSLPSLSPSEISRDVTREFNNRTGSEEFIAPTFDPFEQDSSMAGAVSLRSAGVPVTTIDGEVLSNGAMLDMNFYYNTPSDDPYDTRGFTDVAFLSGSFAPAVRRNNRILECSRNVEKVVYDHRYYSSPLFVSIGLNRGFRRYTGHRGYGRFDRAYWRNRGAGNFGYGLNRNRVTGRTSYPRGVQSNNRNVNRNRTDANDRNRNDRDRNRTDDRRSSTVNAVRMDRRGRMNGTVSRTNQRPTNTNRTRTTQRSENANRNNRSNQTTRVRNVENRMRTVPATTNQNNSARGRNRNNADRRQVSSENRNNRARVNPAVSSTTERATRRSSGSDRKNQSAQASHSQTRQQSAPKQRSAPKARSNSNQRSNNSVKRSAPQSRNQSTNRSNIRRKLNFFPGSNSYGRDVVRNVSVDCAREETLSVFIPAQRLDAARFDGLTVLALDNRGQEYPVFIPPNYIEGFKQAIGGNYIRHNGTAVPSAYSSQSYSSNPYSTSPYREQVRPQVRVEAVCPTGTLKQNDGTCLLVNGSYPR